MPQLPWASAKAALEARIKREIEEFELKYPTRYVNLSITRTVNPNQLFVDIIVEPRP